MLIGFLGFWRESHPIRSLYYAVTMIGDVNRKVFFRNGYFKARKETDKKYQILLQFFIFFEEEIGRKTIATTVPYALNFRKSVASFIIQNGECWFGQQACGLCTEFSCFRLFFHCITIKKVLFYLYIILTTNVVFSAEKPLKGTNSVLLAHTLFSRSQKLTYVFIYFWK